MALPKKSIVTRDLEHCIFCKRPADDTHHVFGGSNRQASDKWDIVVPVCRGCHERVHHDIYCDRMLKQKAQTKFEEMYGHDKYMSVIGRNYL